MNTPHGLFREAQAGLRDQEALAAEEANLLQEADDLGEFPTSKGCAVVFLSP